MASDELYKKYRPTRFREMWGQEAAVQTLVEMGKARKVPHCLLLVGPSGCGKTTAARILKRVLKCADVDFEELNCAGDARGIDTIREIKSRMSYAPAGGECRIWLLDEAAKLTNDAQTALLKMTEDTPGHVYFMLATTDPQRLISTIRTRATVVEFKRLKPDDMKGLLKQVAASEKFKLSDEVEEAIIEEADGSPRKALVLLNQALWLPAEDAQLAAITSGEMPKETMELCRALINPRVSWSDVASILRGLDDEPERIRRAVLGYAQSVLLRSGKARAYEVLDAFRDNVFDSGKPGLVACAYQVVKG